MHGCQRSAGQKRSDGQIVKVKWSNGQIITAKCSKSNGHIVKSKFSKSKGQVKYLKVRRSKICTKGQTLHITNSNMNNNLREHDKQPSWSLEIANVKGASETYNKELTPVDGVRNLRYFYARTGYTRQGTDTNRRNVLKDFMGDHL